MNMKSINVLLVILAHIYGSYADNHIERNDSRIQIAGGKLVVDDEAVYMCGLRKPSSPNNYCGCAILSRRWVVTVAHCVASPYTPDYVLQNIKIAVGSLRSDSGLLLGLAKVIIHGDYNPDPNTETFRANNDISLLKVDKDIDFGQNTNFIRNSSRDVERDSLMELTGWGNDENGRPNTFLQKTMVNHLSNVKCRRRVQLNEIPKGVLCGIPSPGSYTTPGDSGSPLTQNNELVAIHSTVFLPAKITTMVKIGYFHKWIEVMMSSN